MTTLAFTPALAPNPLQLTELVLHSTEQSLEPILLPMISALSRQDGWTVLIEPPEQLNREALERAGVQLDRIWILRRDRRHGIDLLAKRALQAGTCTALICWHKESDDPLLLTELKQIPVRREMQCLLIRH